MARNARPRLVIISRAPSRSTLLHITFQVTVVKSKYPCVQTSRGKPKESPRWVPLNVIIKVNIEESPSRFTLEGLHDRVVSEVVKEEIILDDHDQIATLQD